LAAQIEDLQARYLFALAFMIRRFMRRRLRRTGYSTTAARRHQITNIVIKVEGNKAMSRSSWFHVGNDNPQRANTIGGFGHYEDDLVKVNGKWFFTKRKIYNEGNAQWQYKGTGNPAW